MGEIVGLPYRAVGPNHCVGRTVDRTPGINFFGTCDSCTVCIGDGDAALT